MLRFKDMFPMGIEYRPGEDELTNYRALRRKRTIGVGEGGPIGESVLKESFGKVHPVLKKELGTHGDHAIGMAGSDKGVAVSFDRPKDVNALKKQMSQHGYKSVTQVHDTTGKHKHVYHFQESNENPVDAYMDAGKHTKKVTPGYAFKHKKIKDPVTGHTILVHQLQSEGKTICPKCEGEGCEHCDNKGYHIEEALSVAMRLKKARDMRRNKAKIKLGKARASRRTADMNVLRRRARKAAYKLVYQKITKNIPKDELSPQRKAEIEKRMSKPAMKAKVERVARKMMRTVRQRELDRKKSQAAGTN